MQEDTSLIWIDLEMTGLDPQANRILEIGSVVTTADLEIVALGPNLVIHQSQDILDKMDDWNQEHHRRSGLYQQVQHSTITQEQAQSQTLAFLSQHIGAGLSPICGNSIFLDKAFLTLYMPELAKYFHYRMIDVSTIKELARRWSPDLLEGFQKDSQHRAVDDILDSIQELKYYRKYFFYTNQEKS